LFLAGAIGTEVAGTVALRALATEFRWGPATVVAVGVAGLVLIVAGVGVLSLSGAVHG
jgi:hypothetical protein